MAKVACYTASGTGRIPRRGRAPRLEECGRPGRELSVRRSARVWSVRGPGGVVAGAAVPSGFERLAVWARPGRRLPAGAPLLLRFGHPDPHDADCRDYGVNGQDKAPPNPGAPGGTGGPGPGARIEDEGGPQGSSREGQADARTDGRPGQRSAARRGGRARRSGRRRGGRDVGGERGQLGAGPCGQRLARSRIKFVLGQPSMHECGLEGIDHLLAVGVACPEPLAAAGSCGSVIAGMTCA